jgi:hypothetical protein
MRWVEIVNAEMKMGRVEILQNCSEILSEMRELVRDPRNDKNIEHPACENHLCDAFLYLVRHVKNYTFTEAPKRELDPDKLAKQRMQDKLKQIQRSKQTPWWRG